MRASRLALARAFVQASLSRAIAFTRIPGETQFRGGGKDAFAIVARYVGMVENIAGGDRHQSRIQCSVDVATLQRDDDFVQACMFHGVSAP